MNTMIVEVKTSGKWTEDYVSTDPVEVFRSLSDDLYRKKIIGSQSIRSIRRTVEYDGFEHITVTQSNDVRHVYTVRF